MKGAYFTALNGQSALAAILSRMSKRTLMLLFGGESAEHDVSIRSARNVYQALDENKYNVVLCYIDRHGLWWRTTDIGDTIPTTNRLEPLLGERVFMDGAGERIQPDVLLPILHGPNGEDGSVQGLAQLLHLPIVGCGILGSAVCMDKDVTKRLLLQAGLPVVEYVLYHRGEAEPTYADIAAKLGPTVFVKPANMGSSVGVGKATDAKSFVRAMRQAWEHDHKVLIERAIIGRELECAVLGNDRPEVSVVGEIIPQEEFYTYHAKYADDSQAQTSTTVDLPTATSDRIRELAVQAYRVLECRGLARVDFFLTDDGEAYVNELNTLPGFTNISMYPQLWAACGLSYATLLDRLVQYALE